MADEDLNDYQVDSVVPPGGFFGDDDEEDEPENRQSDNDQKPQRDWLGAADKLRKQARGSGPQPDSPVRGAAARNAREAKPGVDPAIKGNAAQDASSGPVGGKAAAGAGASRAGAGPGALAKIPEDAGVGTGLKQGVPKSGKMAGGAPKGPISSPGTSFSSPGLKPDQKNAQPKTQPGGKGASQFKASSPNAKDGGSFNPESAKKLSSPGGLPGGAGGKAGSSKAPVDPEKIQKVASALQDDSRGTVGKLKEATMEGATAAADAVAKRYTAGTIGLDRDQGKLKVNILGVFKIRLLYLILGLIVIQILPLILVMIISTVAICQAASVKVFGVDLGLKAVDVVTGFNISGMCDSVNAILGGGGSLAGGGVVARGCSPKESGGCTYTTIAACPAMAAQGENAIRACNQESAGGQVAIPSSTDKCELPDGRFISFSIGLWQINMLDSTQPEFSECKDALILTGQDRNRCVTRDSSGKCIVTYRSCRFGSRGEAGYTACKNALSDPVRNTRQACTLFNQRGWGPWPHTRKVCRLP